MSDDLPINRRITIPGQELETSASRSSGPGGQHANKASTRVTLTFNIETTSIFSTAQQTRVLSKLRHRLTADGELKVSADSSRSQKMNLEEARSRMASILAKALLVPKSRVKTKPSRRAKARRLDSKKKQGDKKKMRKKPPRDD
jgi:ribosome-associated protein